MQELIIITSQLELKASLCEINGILNIYNFVVPEKDTFLHSNKNLTSWK